MAGGTIIDPFTEPGRPIGVDAIDAAWQVLYTGAPVHIWHLYDGKLIIDSSSQDIINGYSYIGIREGKVIATVLRELAEEWVIEVVSEQVYVIKLAKDPAVRWTLGPLEPDGKQEILAERSSEELLPRQKFIFHQRHQ